MPTENGFASIFTMLDGMISDLNAGDASDLPIDDLKSAVAHVADQRAQIGSEMNKADNQRTVLENRRLLLTEDISSMEDADIAELVTKLQTLMMNKDAAQQAFARISQMTLFDRSDRLSPWPDLMANKKEPRFSQGSFLLFLIFDR